MPRLDAPAPLATVTLTRWARSARQDVFFNYTDRFPFVAKNLGNAGNVMFDDTKGARVFVGIDLALLH